jgi:CheY-like chemotaxis protein
MPSSLPNRPAADTIFLQVANKLSYSVEDPHQSPPGEKMHTRRRILVVDDEPLIASLIADWLLELEYEVAGPVNNAPEALQIAEQTRLDAALLDVTLGTGDSFSLAEALLARGVPVAFITGHDARSMPAPFKSSPVLGKPFDFDALKALLDGIVASAGQVPPAE